MFGVLRYFLEVEVGTQFSSCHEPARMASDPTSFPTGISRWPGFHMASSQVTALSGRTPDGKTGDGSCVFMESTSFEKRGCWYWGMWAGCKTRAFTSHLSSSSPFLKPSTSQPTGNFQARVFPFQSDRALGHNSLCHKTRELRKAEVGWNYF